MLDDFLNAILQPYQATQIFSTRIQLFQAPHTFAPTVPSARDPYPQQRAAGRFKSPLCFPNVSSSCRQTRRLPCGLICFLAHCLHQTRCPPPQGLGSVPFWVPDPGAQRYMSTASAPQKSEARGKAITWGSWPPSAVCQMSTPSNFHNFSPH